MNTYPRKPTTFDEFVAPFSKETRAIAFYLRRLVGEVLPQVDENIYGGLKVANALYSIGGPAKVFCGIQPDLKGCKLFLHNIAEINHPTLKLEGKGRHARHIKIKEVKPEEEKFLKQLIRKTYKPAD